MHSRELNKCIIDLQDKWLQFKAAADKIGLKIAITCTSRTYQEQVMLYAQGRQNLGMVNHLRMNCGYPPITEQENRKVTWTLESKHIIHDNRVLSEAIDYVIIKDNKVTWDVKADINQDGISDYVQLAQVAANIGLTPGAYFKTPDYCHIEVR